LLTTATAPPLGYDALDAGVKAQWGQGNCYPRLPSRQRLLRGCTMPLLVLLALLQLTADQVIDAQTTSRILRPDMNNGARHSSSHDATRIGGGGSLSPAGFPGTAAQRQLAARAKVRALPQDVLNGDWGNLRKDLLSSCGLRPARTTSHCFADYNHVDCCAMYGTANENAGRVEGIVQRNQLGGAITSTSVAEPGDGGSWCTCQVGAGRSPPRDVCHVQFEAALAFKLVWCPAGQPDSSHEGFHSFVLVDDTGALLARGQPSGVLPYLDERRGNWEIVAGSKYAEACRTEHQPRLKSDDQQTANAASWSKPRVIDGASCVRPRLKRLPSGPLLLSGGRMCVEQNLTGLENGPFIWLNGDGMGGLHGRVMKTDDALSCCSGAVAVASCWGWSTTNATLNTWAIQSALDCAAASTVRVPKQVSPHITTIIPRDESIGTAYTLPAHRSLIITRAWIGGAVGCSPPCRFG
jgi:hypothetical protein